MIARKLVVMSIAVLVTGTTLGLMSNALAQTQGLGTGRNTYRGGTASGPAGTAGYSAPTPRSTAKLQEARQKLKEATTDEEKAQATRELEQALGEYFDKDLEARQQELEDIKKRVTEMEEHLQKRKDAKDEIVQLQLKTFVNEAEGLGFFGGPITPTDDMTGSFLGGYRPSPPVRSPASRAGSYPLQKR